MAGKGSKTRVKNIKAFRSNYDEINWSKNKKATNDSKNEYNDKETTNK